MVSPISELACTAELTHTDSSHSDWKPAEQGTDTNDGYRDLERWMKTLTSTKQRVEISARLADYS